MQSQDINITDKQATPGTRIETEAQYNALLKRVEQLMLTVPDDRPADDPEMAELIILGNLVADYSDAHYAIGRPSLIAMIKLRMYEMSLNQTSLGRLLGVSPSRISEYLTGKREPTLQVARRISQRLNIDPSIVLG